MTNNNSSLDIKIYPPEAQAAGQFDGGRITEIKPVGFPNEGPEIENLGPLFYWAWATARGYGKIGLHPHQAFEIMSYALEGEIGHYDTLGNRSRIKAGGAQVMQAGSGISHEEATIGESNEFFQIWFDPNVKKAFHHQPTYHEYKHEDFLIEENEGVTIKTVLGKNSPVLLQTEVSMQDISIKEGYHFQYDLLSGKTLAIVVISGKGILFDTQQGTKHYVGKKDFILIHAGKDGQVSFQADTPFRFAVVEVPSEVNYPLYRN
ncbi:MAG: pirin family protein [Nitrospinota bacterium]